MSAPTEQQSRAFQRRLARHAGLEFVVLEPDHGEDRYVMVNPTAAKLLSDEVCRHFGLIPVSYLGGVVTVATHAPSDHLAREVAATLIGRQVEFVVAPEDQIVRAIARAHAMPDFPFPTPEPPPSAPAPDGTTAVPAFGVRTPFRLGDGLVARRLCTEEQVQEALAEQARTGSRIGTILTAKGIVSEEAVAEVLAEQHELAMVDLTDFVPRPEIVDLLPEPLCRRLRCVPVGADEEHLYVAVSDILDDETVRALHEHTSLELRGLITTKTSIDLLLQRLYGAAYVTTAQTELLKRYPEDSANRVVTSSQRTALSIGVILIIALLILWPVPTLIGAIAVSSVFYTAASLYKFKLVYASLGHEYEIAVSDEEVAALDERELPIYTLLVPLYREADVVPRLVESIGNLDYPASKLDIRLLCEEDDDDTVEVILALNLPPQFRLVVVPDAPPKTKPKACNYGLIQAEGTYVVIYDAEDRPDRDQLKRVVLAYQKADPRVTCIQTKLNYFNQRQNLLTRWFSAEYSMWFDLLLPGLDAENVPIPLGGTSNHFVRDRLMQLAAWDPYNVTEDADLGIRLHKAGFKTAIIDSTTLEEANSRVDNWLRQRSRWIKGYIQTYLVHMRNPLKLIRSIGIKGFISFQLLIGATFLFLLNPIFWALTTLFVLTEAGFIQDLFPSIVFYLAAFQLFIGNFVFVFINVAAAVERGYHDLAKYALLSPLYWGLMSIAAWKGFLQLFTKPFYWEKTEHGLDPDSQARAGGRSRRRASEPTESAG